MLIDTHSHLFDTQYDGPGEREEAILRMKEAGVETITVGTSYAESVLAVALAEKYSEERENGYKMWATIGQHPTDQVDEIFDIDKYRELSKSKVVMGVGECGLDYVQSKFSKLPIDDEKERQKNLFIEHIKLAKEIRKPLMIHCREAYQDLLDILDSQYKSYDLNMGTIHFFAGNWSVAQEFLKRNFALSFPGTITFPIKVGQTGGQELLEVVKMVPSDMYLIETDAPYVAPVPHRGKRNEPSYVHEVAKRVAEIRGLTHLEVGEQATANARRIFAL